MNPAERLAKWQTILAAAEASLASVRERFANVDPSLVASIRNGWKNQVKTASDFVSYYEEKLA